MCEETPDKLKSRLSVPIAELVTGSRPLGAFRIL